MEEEETEADKRKKGRMRLVAVMLVLTVIGVALYFAPIFLYPDNVVHSDTLGETNDHSTQAQLTLEKGTYEVWMTTSLWSWLYLDQPIVHVNTTVGGGVDVDYIFAGDDRTIEGDDCRHFASFVVRERTTCNITVIAGMMDIGMPGTERVYVVEERPSAYAPMQWMGIIVMIGGIMGLVIILLLISFTSSEERKRERLGQTPPPGMYPHPGHPPYPPPQQPPYGQYPPPQYPPPYPPPQQRPPAYPPPGHQPPPGQDRRAPPPY